MHVYSTRIIPPGFELQDRLKLIAAERPHLAKLIHEGAEYEERVVGANPPEVPATPAVFTPAPPAPRAEAVRTIAPVVATPKAPEPAIDHSANLVAEVERQLSLTPEQRATDDVANLFEGLFPGAA